MGGSTPGERIKMMGVETEESWCDLSNGGGAVNRELLANLVHDERAHGRHDLLLGPDAAQDETPLRRRERQLPLVRLRLRVRRQRIVRRVPRVHVVAKGTW